MKSTHLMWPTLLIILFTVCSACSAITPYKIDVRQGNALSQEMAVQLKKGMVKEQVRFILGTPLLMDIFHADRWDYVYLYNPGSRKDKGNPQNRRLTVYFVNDKLDHVGGDIVAAAPEQINALPTASQGQAIDISPEGTKKKVP